MPDVRRHPIAAPIGAPFLALILVTMLGNSGLACACALAALDAPATTHHGMSGDHAVTMIGDKPDCGSSCGSHAVTAPGGKSSDAIDQRVEKPLPPPVHHGTVHQDFVPGLSAQSQYEKQHPPLPLSTPVSRSDTLLD
jgi:hypothetical protein